MIRVPRVTREVSCTGYNDAQVIVAVSSTPDSDYLGTPKEVMYGYLGHADHHRKYLYESHAALQIIHQAMCAERPGPIGYHILL